MDQQSIDKLKEKIINPENIKKIMPEMEEHIDYFLKVKLPKEMPMISMFVGEKMITQLKGIFMTELEELFPVIMKKYMDNLREESSSAQVDH